jgi:CRP/FNR family transcriptional regulator
MDSRAAFDLRPLLQPHAERHAVRELSFGPRSTIFRQGDEADEIYQVLDGAVMLYRLLPDGRRQLVELLAPGDLFGCAPHPLRDCAAEALMPTRCVAFERDLITQSGALAQEIGAQLTRQLGALHEHVLLLGRKSALERIASFLMRHVPDRGQFPCPGPGNGRDGAHIHLTLLRQEIADYLGLTIETVSRLLTALRRRGIVRLEGLDEVAVDDICRLCRLTGTHLSQSKWCSAQAREAAPREP